MESEWVDFRVVKQSVSMEMVLDHYHINGLRKNGNELRGQCPIHKGESARSFHVNVSKNVFQCFSCKARGNVLDFVAAIEGCTVRDAALKLKAWFGEGESDSRSVLTEQASMERKETEAEGDKIPAIVNPPLGFQLRVDSLHDYGITRGFSKETLEYFGAGFCLSKGTFAGRFLISLHNDAGELIGYAGRSIDDSEPRYLFPSSEKGFFKSHLLYNLHRAAQAGCDSVVVVEGFVGAMWVYQAGFAGVVALLGSSMSEAQEDLLCRYFKKALLLFDGDEAGRGATDSCLQRLGRRLWVKAISLPDDVQPDHLDVDAIKQLLGPAL
jgi:DNA primase